MVIAVVLLLTEGKAGALSSDSLEINVTEPIPLRPSVQEGASVRVIGKRSFEKGDFSVSLGGLLSISGRTERGGYDAGGFVPRDESFSNRRFELDFHDTFISYRSEKVYTSAGYQRVQWSRFVEKGPIDLFNAEDLRYSWTIEKSRRKISSLTARLEITPNRWWNVEAVIVPLAVAARLPMQGERWFSRDMEPPRTILTDYGPIYIDANHTNPLLNHWSQQASVGMRGRFFLDSFDISLIAYHGYTPGVTIESKTQIEQKDGDIRIAKTYMPVIEKETVWGISFSGVVKDAVVYGETAIALNRRFTSARLNDVLLPGIGSLPVLYKTAAAMGNEWENAIGVNYSWEEYTFSLQSGVAWVIEPDNAPYRGTRSVWCLLSVGRPIRTTIGIFDLDSTLFWDAEKGDGMLRLSFESNPVKNLSITASLIAFPGYGEKGYLSNFRDNTEVRLLLTFYP
ncbi:MAG: hypothetical protein HY097_00150 [Nitrospinae bacterium]|nr:hypothetical protein [Nitrospinota bacterium]